MDLSRQGLRIKPRFRTVVWLLVFCAITSALAAQGPGNTFAIYGRVYLPGGEAARRVVVKLSSASGLDRQGFSDNEGRYEFGNVPRGRYHVSASNPNNPQQFTDPVEADTGRSMSNRLLVHIFLRNQPVAKGETSKSTTVSVTEAAQHIPKQARKAFDEALKHSTAGKTDKALASFEQSIQLYPAYFQALSERGHLFLSMGKISEAQKDFARALELDSRYGPALRGSGLCKFQQGKFADAAQDLEQSTESEPGVAKSYLFLGIAQLSLGRNSQARLSLQQALRLDEIGAARAHVHLADLNVRENRMHEAAAELRAFLQAVPNAPDAEKFKTIEAQIRAQLQKP